MKELGRRGGKASGGTKPEQVPASLRDELRNLDPKVVRAAIEQTLAGGNESARVSAVKLLADVDAFRKDGEDACPRCAKFTAAASAEAQEKVWTMISRYVELSVRAELRTPEPTEALRAHQRDESNDSQANRLVREAVRRGIKGHEEGLEAAVEAAFGKVIDSLAGGFVPGDVNAEQAEATLAILEERGLIVSRGKVEELAGARALELLGALKAEHGIPA